MHPGTIIPSDNASNPKYRRGIEGVQLASGQRQFWRQIIQSDGRAENGDSPTSVLFYNWAGFEFYPGDQHQSAIHYRYRVPKCNPNYHWTCGLRFDGVSA